MTACCCIVVLTCRDWLVGMKNRGVLDKERRQLTRQRDANILNNLRRYQSQGSSTVSQGVNPQHIMRTYSGSSYTHQNTRQQSQHPRRWSHDASQQHQPPQDTMVESQAGVRSHSGAQQHIVHDDNHYFEGIDNVHSNARNNDVPWQIDQFQRVSDFIRTPGCRRRALLDFFGEEYRPGPCNSCDYCLNPQVSAQTLSQFLFHNHEALVRV